ncbi:LLM class flavin-dependent oxidoreductase [Anabaena cylindrica FACHB-243]|uniref:Luciferase-like, subgroup n=1 Tax=Anabaena cylindrica (strain ATCC 27899 / PCC 7122) TaxID=272123 RepID=K9ZM15_ANACC|nr:MULTISPECIES: LLM class flavin-dependent oxidoreductase [Anabaena]AFZ60278.1 Luciferase-like, subgroup [Anabaena cylindrica PCC 7122]MBD2417669.1 LLM class flavin-dependent oxidoreductase [Anabaena cylindrica FACHB-243]MBY5281246.1 LLM class flavin-dependent oxidoreductase [Anabaena sp. CCAP 1446/1C]MBY5306670.1 LLM class flavin-dependent oxidoreductase [Anabaena sp. CCAP 1446/1C]MCM2404584.1 LLM class flavin-dependent oxidoreductase [Anabaena sp. CCAP 1446/1C]
MKTGLFCNYENHHQDARRAIFEQVLLVKQAENLDFEEAWVSEHHFNESNLSPSLLLLMAHLAGITSTIRLGTGAVLLPFHDPIRVAEDIATLDNLCSGRLAFGVAKGGPFPEQNKHFGVLMSESRVRMVEAIALIQKLLYETDVSFNGQFYQCDRLTVYPQPLQKPIPVYIASGDDDTIEYAAQNSFGLMGGPPFSLTRLKNTVSKYRQLNSSGADKLLLARFFFVAKTTDEAVSEALPFIRKFSQKMTANSTQVMQNSPQPQKPFDRTNICFEEDYLLENSIIGDVETCRDRIKKFQDELNLGTLALKPSSLSLQKNRESMQRYNQEVRNYV